MLNDLRALTPLGQSFSAGVAEWDGQESPERLVGRADVGLYEAKRAGRDRVVMAPSPLDDDPHPQAADPTPTETAPERRRIDTHTR
jgi:diguanylate cyclase